VLAAGQETAAAEGDAAVPAASTTDTDGAGDAGRGGAGDGAGKPGGAAEPGRAGTGDGAEVGDGQSPMDGEVTVVPGIARYHRRGCILIRFLSDGDMEIMTRREAEAADLMPCKACQPDKPDPPG